jgi:hypothetical protein
VNTGTMEDKSQAFSFTCTFHMLDGRTVGCQGTSLLLFLPASESLAGLKKRSSERRAISGVTFFGLKRSARAAACSAVDSPPHVLN